MVPIPEPSWLVQVTDKPGDEIAQERRNNLAAHMAANKKQIDLGHLVMAGPAVQALPQEFSKAHPIITGSIMVWKGGSEAEVRAWLSENPYAITGVWDLESATVTPFLCVVRKPL